METEFVETALSIYEKDQTPSSCLRGIFLSQQTVTLICSPLYHNRRLMITYCRNNRQAYLALKVLWLKIIHKFVRIVENISPCPLLPRVKSGILLVLYLEVCSTLPFKKSFCYAQKLKCNCGVQCQEEISPSEKNYQYADGLLCFGICVGQIFLKVLHCTYNVSSNVSKFIYLFKVVDIFDC